MREMREALPDPPPGYVWVPRAIEESDVITDGWSLVPETEEEL